MTIKEETGEKRQFSTGAKRQASAGKGLPSLFPGDGYIELCKHFEDGAVLHGDRNWEKGLPLASIIDSLERHIAAEKMGDTSERHDRAIGWNALVYLTTKTRIKEGLLPADLDDMPKYEQQSIPVPPPEKHISVYFSHYIRGPKGHEATDSEIEYNMAQAILVADQLRHLFPQLDMYVPAEHEDFIGIAYADGLLTEQQLLDVDCKILEQKDCVLAFAPDNYKLSRGMQREIVHARLRGIPQCHLKELDQEAISVIKEFLNDV